MEHIVGPYGDAQNTPEKHFAHVNNVNHGEES